MIGDSGILIEVADFVLLEIANGVGEIRPFRDFLINDFVGAVETFLRNDFDAVDRTTLFGFFIGELFF